MHKHIRVQKVSPCSVSCRPVHGLNLFVNVRAGFNDACRVPLIGRRCKCIKMYISILSSTVSICSQAEFLLKRASPDVPSCAGKRCSWQFRALDSVVVWARRGRSIAWRVRASGLPSLLGRADSSFEAVGACSYSKARLRIRAYVGGWIGLRGDCARADYLVWRTTVPTVLLREYLWQTGAPGPGRRSRSGRVRSFWCPSWGTPACGMSGLFCTLRQLVRTPS